MKYYDSYMDRQEISRETHGKLLELSARRRPGQRWLKYGALAACAALIVGVGVWRLVPVSDPPDISCEAGQFAADYTPLPGETDTVGPDYAGTSQTDDAATSFVVSSPTEGGKQMFPMIPYINYSSTIDHPDYDMYDMALDRVYAPGSFMVDLTKEDIQTIFWGPEGKPEAVHPKTEQGDLPWMLFWGGYTIRGSALYDGQGRLVDLTISGERDRASFTLALCPGALPFSCVVYADSRNEPSDVLGVSVAGWSRVYDRFGGSEVNYICGSEFMTEGGVGVRFVNQNSPMQAEYGGDEDMALGGTQSFNALFVRQAIAGGLYLDHLTTAEPDEMNR